MKRNVLVTWRKSQQLVRMFIASVFVTALLALTMVLPTYANNIQVDTVTLNGAYVQFNLSWDNSWKDATNWDTAWVFAKYKKQGETTWNHAYL